MKRRNIAKAGAAATAAALLLTGCQGSADNGGDDVVLYTTNNQNAVGAVVDSAAAQEPPLNVEVVQSSSTVAMLERIQSEGEDTLADVYYSAVPRILEDFSDSFEPYESPEAAALPEELIQPEHLWTVQNTHVAALMVNTDQLDDGEAPTSWEELADPRYDGMILSGNPAESGTSDTNLFAAYRVLGEEGFTRLWENLVITSNTDTLYPSVSQGEYAITLGYEANIYPYIEGGQAGIELVYPEDGTATSYEAIAVMKHAPNPEAAKRLADSILSEEAQVKLLQESFRRPSRTDINPSDYIDIPPIEEINVVPSDEVEFADKYAEYTALYESLQ